MHGLAMTLGQSALVLKEFELNYDGPEFIHIVARKSGLISFLLTLLGIDATTTFRVFADRIEFVKGSLSGQISTTMPLSSISITTCGYTKPIALIVLGVIFLLLTIPVCLASESSMWIFIFLIAAIICFIYYFLNKSLLIWVVSNSSWPAGLCFKRSVIEGVNVEYEQAQEVIRIINELTMSQNSK